MGTKEPAQKGTFRHGLIMVLCCLIPLAILGVLWARGIGGIYVTIGFLLLCPLSHIVMMLLMRKHGGEHEGHQY